MSKPTRAAITQEARLNSICSRMTTAINIVKLAQFAVEARRTLQGIDDLTTLSPEVAAPSTSTSKPATSGACARTFWGRCWATPSTSWSATKPNWNSPSGP